MPLPICRRILQSHQNNWNSTNFSELKNIFLYQQIESNVNFNLMDFSLGNHHQKKGNYYDIMCKKFSMRLHQLAELLNIQYKEIVSKNCASSALIKINYRCFFLPSTTKIK